MRLVVTGSNGQLARALFAKNANAFFARGKRVQIIPLGRPQLGLTRPETLAHAIANARPDVIVSAAAFTDVDGAENQSEAAFLINETGAGAVAKCAADLDIPIIHISSDYVFDGLSKRPYREEDAATPLSVYGRSKRAGEKAVIANTDNHMILRTAWLVSPFGRNFATAILQKAALKREISVVSDQIGSPTIASDLADAIVEIGLALTARPTRNDLNGVFHLCGSASVSRADFARAILAASAKRGGPYAEVKSVSSLAQGNLAKRPANSQMSSQKIAKIYGLTLPDLRLSLDKLVREFYLQQPLPLYPHQGALQELRPAS